MCPSIRMDSQISSNTDQSNRDYVDDLLPGFRFCPTDQELIVNYLQPKLESRRLPPARIHEEFIYDYNPEELAETYQSVENKWYFMTPRERMCPNGNRPKRTTKKNGYWKTGNAQVAVCDVTKRRLGYKRNLAYYDEKKRKTKWLMTEYTTTDPNLPVGNGTKLNDFVLCKIYKKEEKGDRNLPNEDKGNEEQNQPDDEPSPKRQRLNPGSNPPNEPQHVWIQEANHHLVALLQPANCYQQEGNNIDTEGSFTALTGASQPFTAQTLLANQASTSNHDTMSGQTRIFTSHYPITNNSSSTQPQLETPHAMTEKETIQSLCGSSTCEDQQIQSTLIAIDKFLNGDSSSTEMETDQPPYYTIDTIQSSVTSTNGPPDRTADQVLQPDEDFFELNPTNEFRQLINFSHDDQVHEPAHNDTRKPLYDEDFFDLNPTDAFLQLINFSDDDQPAHNDTTTPLYDEDLLDFSRVDEFPQLLPQTHEDSPNFKNMESDIF